MSSKKDRKKDRKDSKIPTLLHTHLVREKDTRGSGEWADPRVSKPPGLASTGTLSTSEVHWR